MVILMTGVTSSIGRQLLSRLVHHQLVSHVIVLGRRPPLLDTANLKISFIQADLTAKIPPLPRVDRCIHLAALTHSHDEQRYFEVNHRGTMSLAKSVQQAGCNKFWLISSYTAGWGAGAYAESKIRAERDLLSMSWAQLLIIRPSEVVGVGGQEGLDRFERVARKYRIYPWLFSVRPIEFHPLRSELLVAYLEDHLESHESRWVRSVIGPAIDSTALAVQTALRLRAIPIPVFVPLIQCISRGLRLFGISVLPPDQIARLLGVRGQSPDGKTPVEEVILTPS